MKNYILTFTVITTVWQPLCFGMLTKETKPTLESLFSIAAISHEICKTTFEGTAKPVHKDDVTKYLLVKQAMQDNGLKFLSVNTNKPVIAYEGTPSHFSRIIERDIFGGDDNKPILNYKKTRYVYLFKRDKLRTFDLQNKPYIGSKPYKNVRETPSTRLINLKHDLASLDEAICKLPTHLQSSLRYRFLSSCDPALRKEYYLHCLGLSEKDNRKVIIWDLEEQPQHRTVEDIMLDTALRNTLKDLDLHGKCGIDYFTPRIHTPSHLQLPPLINDDSNVPERCGKDSHKDIIKQMAAHSHLPPIVALDTLIPLPLKTARILEHHIIDSEDLSQNFDDID